MNGLTLSDKVKKNNKAFIEAAIASYEESATKKQEPTTPAFNEESMMVLEAVAKKQSVQNRFTSFVETVTSTFVTECLYNILEHAIDKKDRNLTNTSILRAMASQYVHENDCHEILHKMKRGSVALSQMHNIIREACDKAIEGCDKDDPNTFAITPEMKDEFYKSLDYSDSQAISDEINSRVSNSINDFINANVKDHEDIQTALDDAQEKIAKTDDGEIQESYNILAKGKITDIRNAPKNVFHSMVSSMCESVIKHPQENSEFFKEGKLDVDKVVSRVSLMYTFMEMLNTSRLEKVDSVFVEGVIRDLKN